MGKIPTMQLLTTLSNLVDAEWYTEAEKRIQEEKAEEATEFVENLRVDIGLKYFIKKEINIIFYY